MIGPRYKIKKNISKELEMAPLSLIFSTTKRKFAARINEKRFCSDAAIFMPHLINADIFSQRTAT